MNVHLAKKTFKKKNFYFTLKKKEKKKNDGCSGRSVQAISQIPKECERKKKKEKMKKKMKEKKKVIYQFQDDIINDH